MKLKAFAYFLILLLVSAPVEDLWVAATVRPAEDTVADEDGEYLPPARHEQAGRPRNRGVQPLTEPAPPPSRPPIPLRTAGAPVTQSQARPGPCLYLFMALLR
jgi:hypothetical protein